MLLNQSRRKFRLLSALPGDVFGSCSTVVTRACWQTLKQRRNTGTVLGIVTAPSTGQDIGYAEFGTWYDSYRAAVLQPALDAAADALDGLLAELLTDRDLARIRSTGGRVKSKRRTWRKIHQPRYQGRINSVDDIPLVVDDLVGLRMTCINVRAPGVMRKV